MKYKHEFAVKHLPKVSIGTFMVSIGVILWLVVLYHILTGVGDFPDFIMAMMGAAGILFGGMFLANGIEYKATLIPKPDPDVEPIERDRKSINQRREEVLSMDFNPSPADIKAAARAKERARKKQMNKELGAKLDIHV